MVRGRKMSRGVKVAHGTLAEVRAQHATVAGDASLEEVFMRVAGEDAGQ